MEENESEEEKKESETAGGVPPDEIPVEPIEQGIPVIPADTQPPKEPPIEECDPMTMNCNEMPKAMETLTKKSEVLRSGIQKLKEINEIMPSEEGKQLYAKTTDEKANVDGKIQDIVFRFSKCRLYEEEEEPPQPPTSPES